MRVKQSSPISRRTKVLGIILIAMIATAVVVQFKAMAIEAATTKSRLETEIKDQKTIQEREYKQKSEAEKAQYDAEAKTREKSLQDEIDTLKTQVQAKKARTLAEAAKAAEGAVARAIVPHALASGSKAEWMRSAGIPESQWGYVDYIISHESGWRYTAVNVSSKATGLCQSLPASKMASAGADYLINPVTQLRWCSSYAQARYGGWAGAYAFWVKSHWW